MIRAFRAELIKITRWSILAAPVSMVVLASGGSFLAITRIHHRPAGALEVLLLSTPEGLVDFLRRAATLLFVISLIMMAASMGEEYGHGTIRTMFIALPERVLAMTGKFCALLLVAVIGSIAALACASVVAAVLGPGQGITVGEWTTAAGVDALRQFSLEVLGALVGWTLIGAALGIFFRSAAAGVGVALAYLLVVETLINFADPDIGQWLPGTLFNTLIDGGNANIPLGTAVWVSLVYMAGFAAASALLVRYRDVTS